MTPCLKCTECLRENFTACLNPPAAQQQEERGTGPILTNPLCGKCAPR